MAKKNIVSVGLDLSLTGTGIVVLTNGKLTRKELIRSKPVGDRPTDELQRIRKIVSDIGGILSEYDPTVVCIEGLAFMARNTSALVQLAALNYMIRAIIFDRAIPFYIVAPTSLKKFITGKGNSDKNVMMMDIYRDYDLQFVEDNQADGFELAAVGAALLETPINKLTVPQKEVVELIKKQI